MKTLGAICSMLLITSCKLSTPSAKACTPLESGYSLVGNPHTADEIEQIGLGFAASNAAVPQVAFAYGNRDWQRTKALVQPGDRFFEFDSPMMGKGGRTPDGYVLMRASCMVSMLFLRMT